MDSLDPNFLQKKSDEEDEMEEENGEEAGESEVSTLLKIVENLNEDFEKYLADEIVDHTLRLPTGRT